MLPTVAVSYPNTTERTPPPQTCISCHALAPSLRGPMRRPVCGTCWNMAAHATGFTPRWQTGSWQRPSKSGIHANSITAAPEQWLLYLSSRLEAEDARQLLARYGKKIGRAGVLAVARADADAADSAGRSIHTSHATASTRARAYMPNGKAPDAKVARRILRALGLLVCLAPGGRLTNEERADANEYHGGRQWNVANHHALSYPNRDEAQAAARFRTPLPRRGEKSSISPSSVLTNARSRARRATTKTEETSARDNRAVWHVIRDLIKRLPHLQKQHTGRLYDGLKPYVEAGWTAYDLNTAINNEGRYTLRPDAQRSPIGLFLAQVRRACTGQAPAITRAATRASRITASSPPRRTEGAPKPANFAELVERSRRQHAAIDQT